MSAGRTFPRWVPLCAAAVVLLQLTGMLHLASAPHGLCPEHGVLVDLEAGAPRVDAAPGPALPGLERAPLAAIRADAHPHCSALWVMRAARTEVPLPGVAVVSEDEVFRPRAPVAVPAPDASVLRLAPKHSPPV